MEYEWGRFVYWLSQGQNAAAVQAIAALGGLTASVLLTAITAWYAWLTKHILVASTLQALDEMRPELNLLVQPTEAWHGYAFTMQASMERSCLMFD